MSADYPQSRKDKRADRAAEDALDKPVALPSGRTPSGTLSSNSGPIWGATPSAGAPRHAAPPTTTGQKISKGVDTGINWANGILLGILALFLFWGVTLFVRTDQNWYALLTAGLALVVARWSVRNFRP
jgi:hypothetical protein